ncbi:MAG TPA: class I SAM-dependent methyltransferase [Spirochaetia bacterium]|nr:class I SAM-dependent methyltransferase [Spirochaetia bacterium]
MSVLTQVLEQAGKPTGRRGRFMARFMNAAHSRMTNWALGQVSVDEEYTVLDIGCGGGRTVAKLARKAAKGKVFGIDLSEESVATSRKTNGRLIGLNRVEVVQGAVSKLPFTDSSFDLATAVETYYFWPDLIADMREILRVLRPGGQLAVIAEAYKGGGSHDERFQQLLRVTKQEGKINYLSAEGLAEALSNAGFAKVQVHKEGKRGWVCALGSKSRQT